MDLMRDVIRNLYFKVQPNWVRNGKVDFSLFIAYSYKLKSYVFGFSSISLMNGRGQWELIFQILAKSDKKCQS
jgi:hypothetical protein